MCGTPEAERAWAAQAAQQYEPAYSPDVQPMADAFYDNSTEGVFPAEVAGGSRFAIPLRGVAMNQNDPRGRSVIDMAKETVMSGDNVLSDIVAQFLARRTGA